MLTPRLTETVVMSDAIKKDYEKGNTFLKRKRMHLFLFLFALIKARARVMGIIARVLVSLTVTALSGRFTAKGKHAVPGCGSCGNGRGCH